MDLLASRLISYAFKGQMDDLCHKVKWSERNQEPPNIPGLGAWTSAFARPPDRRWRITARGTLPAFRVLVAGGWKDFQHGTVRIKARTNSWRLLIMRVRNWKPAKPRRHRGRPPYIVTKNMLLLPDMTSISPNLRPYSLVFLTCQFDSVLKQPPRLCQSQTRTDSRL
jgi:hypothetical protein